jgi:hypothetical protein
MMEGKGAAPRAGKEKWKGLDDQVPLVHKTRLRANGTVNGELAVVEAEGFIPVLASGRTDVR